MKTRDAIISKALLLFNKNGFGRVSTYDIAAAAGISQGNLTYYFPAKNDIVINLTKSFITDIQSALSPLNPEEVTMKNFYLRMEAAYKVHLRYRFLLMAFGDLMLPNAQLANEFKEMLDERKERMKSYLPSLKEKGYLNSDLIIENADAFVFVANMVGTYWVQESSIYHRKKTQKEQVKHYLTVFFSLFLPYMTDLAKQELSEYIDFETLKVSDVAEETA